MNELEKVEKTEMQAYTAKEIRAQVNLIQDVMKSVMIGPTKENPSGVHYGIISGCGDKPTLLKPGAEKLLMTFRLSTDISVDDLSTDDYVRYRVSVKVSNRHGEHVGTGIGESSSNEEKYKWRKVVCEEEFNETAEDRKRIKWCKGGAQGPYCITQIRTNKEDIANTVLKMAKKRALVDAALTVTAASDIFMQDIEDMPEEIRSEVVEKETKQPSRPVPQQNSTPKLATKPQIEAVKKIVDKLNIGEALDMILFEKFSIDSLEKLTIKQASEIIASGGGCLK